MPISVLGMCAGDRQHRHAAALAVEQPVDQVKVAGAAAACAHGQLAGHVGLGAGSEGRAFLVPHVNPLDLAVDVALHAPQRIGEAVERITDDAVHALDAGLLQSLGHVGCCRSGHDGIL